MYLDLSYTFLCFYFIYFDLILNLNFIKFLPLPPFVPHLTYAYNIIKTN